MSSGLGQHGFRRRDASQRASLHFGPNMTPMVDIVMVILVFFMASAAFVGPEWFMAAQAVERRETIPETRPDGGGEVKPKPLLLRVLLRAPAAAPSDKPGTPLATATLRFGQQRKDGLAVLAADGPLQAAVTAIIAGGPVPEQAVILVDSTVRYDAVIAARESLARAGITSVGISASKPEDDK